MDKEGQLSTVPPRAMTVPNQPTPMTNMGILADYGAPSDQENITDIPPDFGWMSGIETFITSWRFNQSDNPGTYQTFYPASKRSVGTSTLTMLDLRADWHFIPFLSSRWWSGRPRLRFMAIKPKQVTGKMIIQWYPDVGAEGPTSVDALQRNIKYEWDLGTSSEYSLELTAYNCTRLRPTWLHFSKTGQGSVYIAPPLVQFSFGYGTISLQHLLQPGSIFPDSIRILLFLSFSQCTFHTSTDIRGDRAHFLSSTVAPDLSYDPPT